MGAIIKFILLLLFSAQLQAVDTKKLSNTRTYDLEDVLRDNPVEDLKYFLKEDGDVFHIYSNDPAKNISPLFYIPPYFRASVHFWFNIYTLYSSEQKVIHDLNNLDLVYSVVDLRELGTNLNPSTAYSVGKRIVRDNLRNVRTLVKGLGKKTKDFKPYEKFLIDSINTSGKTVPSDPKKRIAFFNFLAKNIRVQTGQRNFIRDGILRFKPFEKLIRKIANHASVPIELLSIPFLESSFNPEAESKVKAAGPWQFMPKTARSYFPRSRHFDYRRNPIVASIAGLRLLNDNFNLLKRWDLAVTAYNSGTVHLHKAMRKFRKNVNKRDLSLEFILTNYKHPHLGFASKNFFSEFLALVTALPYKDVLFPETANLSEVKNIELNVFMAKCRVRRKDMKLHYNPQFKTTTRYLNKGDIFISDEILSTKKYLKLTIDQLVETNPKKWNKYLKNQRCSTR